MKVEEALGKQKLLYILNIAKKVNNFSHASMLAAQELGLEFHIAGNWSYSSDEERTADEKQYGIKIHQVDFFRAPYHPGNRRAYIQLKQLVSREKYMAIHCNTPIGGVLGRIVGKQCGVQKVIYQAHGFHFYHGAPKKNWLLYYPVEKWLAHYTDALITINQEDYELAKTRFKLRNGGKVYYVPGVGIDTSQYRLKAEHRNEKRAELGLRETDIALISMGDLIERKNYKAAIGAIAEAKNYKLQYFICGKGPEEANLKSLAEKFGVSSQIRFLGFRSDIKELLAASDIFLFTTKQEGLPRSMMEAMASGLPCIASRIRGNVDLIEEGLGGYLIPASDLDGFSHAINKVSTDTSLRTAMSKYNREQIRNFDISIVKDSLEKIYRDVFCD